MTDPVEITAGDGVTYVEGKITEESPKMSPEELEDIMTTVPATEVPKMTIAEFKSVKAQSRRETGWSLYKIGAGPRKFFKTVFGR